MAISCVKLNVGAGGSKLEGYTPIDRAQGGEAFPLRGNDGQQFETDSIDEIYASHVLEHLSFGHVIPALREWARVLKPGALVKIAVPDIDRILELRQKGDNLWPRYLMGGQVDGNDFHRSVFTAQALHDSLSKAGFSCVMQWETNGEEDTAGHPCSVRLCGQAPAGDPTPAGEEVVETAEAIRAVAVMSVPRLGWNDAWGCIAEAIRPWKLPIRRYTGAFWGHCLQNVLEDCIADKVDWVLCIDYDSLFTFEHVDALFGALGRNKDFDAVCALQPKRKDGTPLCTLRGPNGETVAGRIETDGTPMRLRTGNFGLTAIRLDSLRDIPKPWCWETPGPDGTWTHDEHVDPDIYFWKKWEEYGKTLYLLPTCQIGHLETVVNQFGKNLEQEYVTVAEWRDEHGAPREGQAECG